MMTEESFLYGTRPLMDPKSTPDSKQMAFCAIAVYLDGACMNDLGSGGVKPLNVNRLVAPAMIAGREYYPSGNCAPDKYQSLNGGCGVVLIWTKG
jgi:hypothetical protein